MLKDLLTFASAQGASDLHISSGVAPMLRMHGDIRRIEMPALTPSEIDGYLKEAMTADEYERFTKTNDVDFTCTIDTVRCRANAFVSLRGPSAVFRIIRQDISSLEALGLPPAAAKILELDRGLVLVTGPAGSGKSTTLATLVDLISHEHAAHILTIEDPVEFIHRGGMALVNHRELGTSTTSFARALKSALREDPDVIVVGEMRDLETIQLAITAAETGHLVLGTLHTSSAAKTITRIIDAFPPDKQEQVRTMLAESLQMVLSQVLLKRADGTGRVGAVVVHQPTTANYDEFWDNEKLRK